MQLVQLVVAITSVLFAPAWLVSILLWHRKGKQERRGNTHALAHTHSAACCLWQTTTGTWPTKLQKERAHLCHLDLLHLGGAAATERHIADPTQGTPKFGKA